MGATAKQQTLYVAGGPSGTRSQCVARLSSAPSPYVLSETALPLLLWQGEIQPTVDAKGKDDARVVMLFASHGRRGLREHDG